MPSSGEYPEGCRAQREVGAAKGDVAACTSCSAGVAGPATSCGSLTPRNSFRVLTRRPGRLTLIAILCRRGFLPLLANVPSPAHSQSHSIRAVVGDAAEPARQVVGVQHAKPPVCSAR